MKRLTLEEIQEIGSILHENIQFYNATGQASNATVTEEIEQCLMANIGKHTSRGQRVPQRDIRK